MENKKSPSSSSRQGGRVFCMVDDASSPPCISIEYNGVRAIMVKTVLPGQGVCWSGVPVDQNGRGCRFSLVISAAGSIIGGGAVNYFAAGGWNSNARNALSSDDIASAHEAINRSWLHHVTMVQTEARRESGRNAVAEELNKFLPRGVELYKSEAPVDGSERDYILSMLGAPRSVVTAAASARLAVGLDMAELVGSLVSPKFAE